jgi:hypothetical protein
MFGKLNARAGDRAACAVDEDLMLWTEFDLLQVVQRQPWSLEEGHAFFEGEVRWFKGDGFFDIHAFVCSVGAPFFLVDTKYFVPDHKFLYTGAKFFYHARELVTPYGELRFGKARE